MANIMSSFKLHNKPSRNGFDLSNRHSFTAKIGELLPVQVKECLPGDKFKINLTHFSRLQPLTSPAYVRIKEYYDFCYVPTRLLWRYFDQCVNQMPNNISANSSDSESVTFSRHPYFSSTDVRNYLDSLQADDELGFLKSDTSAKLLQYLGYGKFNQGDRDLALNPFPLLAYQKIYCDIFRFDQWELPLPHTFNVDFLNDNSNLLIDLGNLGLDDSVDMFNMRYANYPKDLIMGVLPNSQFGDVSLTNVFTSYTSPDNLNNYLAISPDGLIKPVGNSTYSKNPTSLYNNPVNFNFSILALRQAEFLQKWKEVAQTAKQDYRDQIKAHWNVNVSKARSGLTEYLGGIVSNVQIDGAINNNLTEGSTIIKGTAISGSRGVIDFEAPEHGILMCIYHAAPILDYDARDSIDPLVLKTSPTDYAIPELDKTGMQLVPFELLSKHNPGMHDNFIGYAPRYIDYKTDIDKTFGAFNSTLRNWVAPFQWYNIYDIIQNGSWNYRYFKVNSRIFGDVFAVQPDSTSTTDQILCNSDFDIKCVRNLDVNGMPY